MSPLGKQSVRLLLVPLPPEPSAGVGSGTPNSFAQGTSAGRIVGCSAKVQILLAPHGGAEAAILPRLARALNGGPQRLADCLHETELQFSTDLGRHVGQILAVQLR